MTNTVKLENALDLLIITGLSGAGKSQAVKCLEDSNYFCVDNLPPSLIHKIIELLHISENKVNKIAVVVDARSGSFLKNLIPQLEILESQNVNYQILYLEASDETLIRRYSETRRKHPIFDGTISEGIKKEKSILENIREKSDYIIDTTGLTLRELKNKIQDFLYIEEENKMRINLISFGYKYGIPLDASLVFDVRFLANPYYVDSLRSLTGNDKEIQDYVMDSQVSKEFTLKFFDFIDFLVKQYIKEGKAQLEIAIGCTGGKHRSVTIVNKLKEFFNSKQIKVFKKHRDIDK